MTTNSVNPTVAWICASVLLLAVLAGIFALSWHGSIPGSDVLAVVGTIIGIAGGAVGVHAGVSSASKRL